MALLAYLRDLNIISILIRILISVFFGVIIGSERSRKNNPAGLRTHILVCLGSALVMMTSQYIFVQYFTSDLARMGAQVISGIGFLGAGTIILSGGRVKGLTTAAGLWTTACLGLALGIGFYEGAIIGFLAILAALVFLRNYSHALMQKSPQMSVYLLIDGLGELNKLNSYLKSKSIHIDRFEFLEKDSKQGIIAVELDLSLPKTAVKADLIGEINKLGGISVLENIG